MNRLILRGIDIPLDFSGWESQGLIQVAAGTDCMMALTQSGHVLKLDMTKISGMPLSRKKADSTFVHELRGAKEIAVSKICPGLASAVLRDGRYAISFGNYHISQWERQRIHRIVSQWENVVQTAVSDCFFALHADGTVSYATIQENWDYYADVRTWTEIKRIVPGSQDSLFGIREDGTVLCTGYNLTKGKDLQPKWEGIRDVVDVCAVGSECENVLYLQSDGRVKCLLDQVLPEVQIPTDGEVNPFSLFSHVFSIYKKPEKSTSRLLTNRLISHFNYIAFAISGKPVPLMGDIDSQELDQVVSFDIGDRNVYANPFIVALIRG